VPIPEVDARPLLIVRAAAQGDPLDRVRVLERPGLDVVELEKFPRVAAPAAGRDVGTSATVAS
jgi:hypothetical protein